MRYRIGCLVLLALTPVALPWSLALLWPAAALALVAIAYAWGGPALLGKSGGAVSLPARIVLAPYRLGALAFIWLRAQLDAPWHEVAPGLLVGRLLSRREAREALDDGVVAVLDLTAEFAECPELLRVPYLNLPVLDLTAPQSRHPVPLPSASWRPHRRRGKVYVHCALGYGRSACVAAACLLASGEAGSAAAAIHQVRAARRRAVFSKSGIGVLRRSGVSKRPASALGRRLAAASGPAAHSLSRMIPSATSSTASSRHRVRDSFRNSDPISAANTTLVSRSAATGAMAPRLKGPQHQPVGRHGHGAGGDAAPPGLDRRGDQPAAQDDPRRSARWADPPAGTARLYRHADCRPRALRTRRTACIRR